MIVILSFAQLWTACEKHRETNNKEIPEQVIHDSYQLPVTTPAKGLPTTSATSPSLVTTGSDYKDYFLRLFREFKSLSLETQEYPPRDTSPFFNYLPDSLFSLVCPRCTATEYNVSPVYYSVSMSDDGPYYILIYAQYIPAGPGFYELHALVLTKDGEYVDSQKLCTNVSTESGSSKCSCNSYGSQIEVHLSEKNELSMGVDNNMAEISDKILIYSLDNNGVLSDGFVSSESIHYTGTEKDRRYAESSNSILSKEILGHHSKKELLIMRNEIFAAHGYIFKNPMLSEYFSHCQWYIPRFDNVTNKLTEIEKENIAIILAVEAEK